MRATCFGGPRHGFSYEVRENRRDLRVVVNRGVPWTAFTEPPTPYNAVTFDIFEYRLERYTNGSTYYYAWIAHGWYVSGYEAKDYVAAGLELIRLLSRIGSCKPWVEPLPLMRVTDDRLVLWAESNGIIDKWCARTNHNPQKVRRLVSYQNLRQIRGMINPVVVKLPGWDSDEDFVEHVKRYLEWQTPVYLMPDDLDVD